MTNQPTCCCRHPDARECFLLRNPGCRRYSDDFPSPYDDAIDEECDCGCHKSDDEDYMDEIMRYGGGEPEVLP